MTAEENKVFMSIFTIVSEGGNSVIDHWYQLAYEERPNVNMVIWNGALRSFVDLVSSEGRSKSFRPNFQGVCA